MARHTRSRSKATGKKARRRSESERLNHDGVVIDINAFSSLPPGTPLAATPPKRHHSLIQGRTRAQGE